MATKLKSIYVDNTDLLREWHDWLSSGETPETRTISDDLARMMQTIASRILQSRYFCGYPEAEREDMASEAVLKMMANLKNYKPSRGRLFGYLSHIVFCACATHLRKHYRRKNAEREMMLCQEVNEALPQSPSRRVYAIAMRAKVEEYR